LFKSFTLQGLKPPIEFDPEAVEAEKTVFLDSIVIPPSQRQGQ
jgi:hypothetical protein